MNSPGRKGGHFPYRKKRKKREFANVLDFVEKGPDNVVWTLEALFWKAVGHKVLVGGRDVRHIIAGSYDLGLVRWVLDVVLDMFQFSLEVTHAAGGDTTRIRTFFSKVLLSLHRTNYLLTAVGRVL